jgi:hypothetical protein
MKRGIGGLLLLIGLALMITGLAMALQGYVHIIYQALDNPLADGAATDEPEKIEAGKMLVWAIVGFAGAPLALVGFMLTLSDRVKRMKARRQARGG